MNVLILSTNRSRLPMPVLPLGACIVAEAAERSGHRVRLLDFMFERDVLSTLKSTLKEFSPDILGLSVRNIDNNDFEKPAFYIEELRPVLDAIRSLTDAPVVLGGAAASVMPEELLRYTGASWAVTGDGEAALPMLLASLSSGERCVDIPGLAWLEDGRFVRNPEARDGQTAHRCWTPDFLRWVDLAAYRSNLSTFPLQTKLGCHFRCVYCTYRKIEGNVYRLAKPAHVAEAVKRLVLKGMRDIEFVDNVFNYPYHHAMEICEDIARSCRGARLQSLELNPLFVDDALISAMERAGFTGIGITVESAADHVLEGLGKGFSAGDVHKAARVIGRHSLPCTWIFMFGGPGETERTVADTLRFAETSIRKKDIAFFGAGIRIYPGTEIENIARRESLLSLPAGEMLRPVFYFSPGLDYRRVKRMIGESMNNHMNFLSSDSIGLSFLPVIHRAGYRLGLRPPLWRYARGIRRGLRLLGMDV